MPLSRQIDGKQYYYYAHYYKKFQAHLMRDKIKNMGCQTRITYGGDKWTVWIQPKEETKLWQRE